MLEATSYLSDAHIMHHHRRIASGIRRILLRELPARELVLVTAGDDLARVAQFLTPGRDAGSASDVPRQDLAEPEINS